MTCSECLRARQLVVHRVYEPNCEQCSFRALAYMTHEQREAYYLKVQHLRDASAAQEVKRNVDLERARIAALSAAMPRKEKET